MQGIYAACCRYLLGDTLSEADVRLFPTIFRFDHVYHLRFLLEKAMIVESYPNLQVCHGVKHVLKGVRAAFAFMPLMYNAARAYPSGNPICRFSQLLCHCNKAMQLLSSVHAT